MWLADAQGGCQERCERGQSILELPSISKLQWHAQVGVEVMVRDVTFDSRRPTTRPRHSTVDGRQPKVGCRFTAVGCRMSNVAETYQPDQVSVVVQVEIEKDVATTQENAAATQEWDAKAEEREKNVIRRTDGAIVRAKDRANAREAGADEPQGLPATRHDARGGRGVRSAVGRHEIRQGRRP